MNYPTPSGDGPDEGSDQSPEMDGLSSDIAGILLHRSEYYSGPLPSPEFLRAYEEVSPGSARMIFDQFEHQGNHRRRLEQMAIKGNEFRATAGMFIGGILVFAAIVGGGLLVWQDKSAQGLAMVITAIGGAVGVFVVGRTRQEHERERQQKTMTAIMPPSTESRGSAQDPLIGGKSVPDDDQ